MSKRSRRKKKQKKVKNKGSPKPPKDKTPAPQDQSQEPPAKPPNRFSKIVTSSWFYLGALATLLSLVGGYFLFAPKVSVVESASFHSQILTSTPFVISNDGNFSIYDVKYTCRILFAHFTNHRQFENESYHYRTFDKLELRAGDKDNVPCLMAVGFKPPPPVELIDADIQLIVSFVPSFWFTPIEKTFRLAHTRQEMANLDGYEKLWAQNTHL
jgi:hypothetical protein